MADKGFVLDEAASIKEVVNERSCTIQVFFDLCDLGIGFAERSVFAIK